MTTIFQGLETIPTSNVTEGASVEQSSIISTPDRGIARVITIRRIKEPEPIKQYTAQEVVSDVEELRRMFVFRFGDLDLPIPKVVVKRRRE